MELSPMSRNLLPWLVTQRDLTRYFGRALRACKRGRVLFFLNRPAREPAMLIALLSYPTYADRLAEAFRSYQSGRFRKMKLENRPDLGRRVATGNRKPKNS
jgi:hypothetical protein